MERLKHLDYDLYMLGMCEPLIRNSEQRSTLDVKKELLRVWISELKLQIKDSPDV